MGKVTGISWTNHTWNPWYGCRKISQGCKNCYMFREQLQYGGDPDKVVRSKTTFNSPIKWNKTSRGSLVFTCSWSDFFIEEAWQWRVEAWKIIKDTPNLTYQILTKRSSIIDRHLPEDWGEGYPNVWLGVSAETQKDADERITDLLKIPARVHFVSIEPMLEEMDIEHYLYKHDTKSFIQALMSRPADISPIWSNKLDWVIVGGESGPNARLMDATWARSIRDQCIKADVPFFFKQWSGLHPAQECELDGVRWTQFPRIYMTAIGTMTDDPKLVTTKLL